MDWRITSSSMVALIAVFTIIWSRVQVDWESEFRSLYESVVVDAPLIDSIWDVYLDYRTDSLVYIKEECSAQSNIPRFRLHIVPTDLRVLPVSSQEFSFDNRDFNFDRYGLRFDDICISKVDLPEYDIFSLRTGQYVGDAHGVTNLWSEEVFIGIVQINSESEFRSLYESVVVDAPLIDSIWDVYLDYATNSLVYVKEECTVQSTVPTFFLHLVPDDLRDLPVSRQEFSFDNRDFNFDRYGLRFDDICINKVDLPEYDIFSLRTGQYIGDDQTTNLWGEEVIVSQN